MWVKLSREVLRIHRFYDCSFITAHATAKEHNKAQEKMAHRFDVFLENNNTFLICIVIGN